MNGVKDVLRQWKKTQYGMRRKLRSFLGNNTSGYDVIVITLLILQLLVFYGYSYVLDTVLVESYCMYVRYYIVRYSTTTTLRLVE